MTQRIGIIGIVLVLIALAYYYRDLLPLHYLRAEVLREAIAGYGVWAPLLFILAYIVVVIAFLPASPMTLLAGALFGVWFGALYVLVGATLGALCAFLIARLLGQSAFTKLLERYGARLTPYTNQLTHNGFGVVFLLRLTPLLPFNGLNLLLGLTHVRTLPYVLGTLLGIIPGVFVYAYAGATATAPSTTTVVITALLFISLTLLGLYLKRRSTAVVSS